jgi:hypothetical protein
MFNNFFDKWIKRVKNPQAKRYETIKNEIEQEAYDTVNEKLDSILKIAEENGCCSIQREHLRPLLITPDAFDEQHRAYLIKLLKELDIRLKFDWEARVSAYLRVPVQNMWQGSGINHFNWRR